MATASTSKTSRIDLRMTDDQKKQIERAASISGTSLSQWSIDRLLESAREVIAQQDAITLKAEAFDSFSAMLDEPINPRVIEFLNEEADWGAE